MTVTVAYDALIGETVVVGVVATAATGGVTAATDCTVAAELNAVYTLGTDDAGSDAPYGHDPLSAGVVGVKTRIA